MDRKSRNQLLSVLMHNARPSIYFRDMLASGEMAEALPELAACVGVAQNPVHHPEGDVFEHTMLVLDSAAGLRRKALNPTGFMLSALAHDIGKTACTQVQPDGKITAYGHEVAGRPLCRNLMGRLTDDAALTDYVENMMWLHMRPNVLAKCRSKMKKTRQLFDLSLCPEDLILLSRADASGKLDAPYDDGLETFLRQRLEDYRRVTTLPMVTVDDLLAEGFEPGETLEKALARARQLHFSGFDRARALRQVIAEATLHKAVDK